MSNKTSWYLILIGIAIQIMFGAIWGLGILEGDNAMQKNDCVTLIVATSAQILMLYMIYKMDSADLQNSKLQRLLLVTGVLLAWMAWEVFIKS